MSEEQEESSVYTDSDKGQELLTYEPEESRVHLNFMFNKLIQVCLKTSNRIK